MVVKVNATLCTWLGRSRQELVGVRLTDLLTPGGRIYHETHYAPMLRMHDTVRELALELVRRDGRRLPVLLNASLERDPAGAPSVIRVAVLDATERRRYERELLVAKERAEASEEQARALARTLQQTLVPPAEPRVPGLEVATAYRPATDGLIVGGDFYDVFPVAHDEWVVLLGDVCGKGAEAAVITSLARWTVRAASVTFAEPSRTLANLNEVLVQHETERFCTAVLVRLRRDGGSWRATLSVGGHPPPVRVAADGGAEPVAAAGPLIGVFDDPGFADHDLVLAPGEGLVLYTDGVTEARRGTAFFDEAGLLASVEAHGPDPAKLVDGLVDDVADFRAGDADDDVAVVALRVPAT
ncbi:SpoIIE family protein phosphatase [Nocardioides sp. TF02-7]|uniref:PP2C family protein-serine/threonine phosphatase n=1 Tax=Nocardioides sp. TF02-7 TaxID=2917724 RepID=UPI001F05BAC5|nr:SpoIIE family protein phosphatase [Nocardioides sp. TF02-7]UMG93485.1 SpoIIE family protein phosphatase [Nocardioides sp. TF02-7]